LIKKEIKEYFFERQRSFERENSKKIKKEQDQLNPPVRKKPKKEKECGGELNYFGGTEASTELITFQPDPFEDFNKVCLKMNQNINSNNNNDNNNINNDNTELYFNDQKIKSIDESLLINNNHNSSSTIIKTEKFNNTFNTTTNQTYLEKRMLSMKNGGGHDLEVRGNMIIESSKKTKKKKKKGTTYIYINIYLFFVQLIKIFLS
jgi:hypothetical protein